MLHLFVYYRVAERDAAAAIAVMGGLQREATARWPGLEAALLRSTEDSKGRVTLMETYRVPEGIDPGWSIDLERRALDVLAGWLVGDRHVEVFHPCA